MRPLSSLGFGFGLSALVLSQANAVSCASKTNTLTPERMIAAPRPDVGAVVYQPIHGGDNDNEGVAGRALIGASEYSFGEKKSSKTLYLVDVPSSGSGLAASRSSGTKPQQQRAVEVVHNTTAGLFLGPDEAAYVIDNTLYFKRLPSSASGKKLDPTERGTPIGAFPANAAIENLRVLAPSEQGGADGPTLLFNAVVYDEDGALESVQGHDESAEEQQWAEVKVYDDIRVREWDTWINPRKRSQLFSLTLQRDGGAGWKFGQDGFVNLFRQGGDDLGKKLETPVPPFGGATDFSATLQGSAAKEGRAAWVSKDPEVPNAWHTKSNIYLAPVSSSTSSAAIREITTGKHGAVSSPTFSPDGERLAWLQQARDGLESDRRQVYLYDFAGEKTHALIKDWDRSPATLVFSADGQTLYLIAEEEEHEKLFALDLAAAIKGVVDEPQVVTDAVGVSNVLPLSDGRLLLTGSTQHSLPELYLLDPSTKHLKSNKNAQQQLQTLTDFNAALSDIDFGPAPAQFSYPGAGGRPAYGWIHFPPGYDAKTKEKYALKVLIHGGPEGCWSDSWSTRWNPAVFAAAPGSPESADERGSIVITMDPAGSTSFGQAYQEEIIHSWGGKPYQDILAGVHYILDLYSSVIDRARVSAAGASYGGYQINWLQGHNNDRLFQALVCHDGIYDLRAAWGETEELWFAEAEHGGVPWRSAELYEKWNPALHAGNWNTRSSPSTASATTASRTPRASPPSTPSAAAASTPACSTSPTRTTGSSTRRTPASGTARSSAGWPSTPPPRRTRSSCSKSKSKRQRTSRPPRLYSNEQVQEQRSSLNAHRIRIPQYPD